MTAVRVARKHRSRRCHPAVETTHRLHIVLDSVYRTPVPEDVSHDIDPLIGQNIGSYVVKRQLGKGGMGAVYELFHAGIGRRMALKVLHPRFATNTAIVKRFFAEARAANVIQHPNIVDITDLDQLPDGSYYILMEFLQGESMASLLKRQKVLSPEETAHIAIPICDALEAAHRAGIVHRDLKPDNIQLIPQPNNPRFVKLLDFGIAKLSADLRAGEPGTHSNVIMGTPDYMSPEQAMGRSKDVDHRTDVYALGVIIFRMLIGRVPFRAPSFGDLMLMHRDAPVPLLERLRPDLSPAWTHVVHTAMAKMREHRFQSMVDMRSSIESAVRTEYPRAGSARIAEVDNLSPYTSEPDSAVSTIPEDEQPTRQDLVTKPWFIPAALTVISAMTAVIVYVIVQTADDGPPSSATDSLTVTTVDTRAPADAGIMDAATPALLVDASTVIDASTLIDARQPDAQASKDKPDHPKPKRATATLWVTARPYARIYVNNRYRGDTDKDVTIPADKNVTIRLENPDLDKKKTFYKRLDKGDKSSLSWNFLTNSAR